MNFKTTIFLLVLVVLVVGAIVYYEAKAPPARPALEPEFVDRTDTTQTSLITDFGDAVSIVVKTQAGAGAAEEWKFERDATAAAGPQAGWRMVAPFDCGVTDWQVAQIATRLKNLKYTVRYEKPADGMTAEQAGLDAPRAVVTLTDENKKSVTVDIGRGEGPSESYVRLAGSDTIYRVQASLKDLVKDQALAYRDQQLAVISPDSVVELEITEHPADAEPATYKIVKSGADWRFLTPAPAKAVTEKIRTLTNSLRTLRAVEWVTADAENLGQYGLDPAPLSITIVSEETPAPTDADSNGAPAPVTKTHTLAFSTLSPLGDDAKAYVRVGEQRAVATVMKSVVDRFRPDLKEWRDNRLFEQEPTRADRITITAGEKTTALARTGTTWTFADDAAPADKNEVQALLDALRDTKALNFETGVNENPARFGFDQPRGAIEVAFADGQTHRIVFGGFADEQTQRLVYARVDDATAAHKLLAADVSRLLREPGAFRDRTVAGIAEDRLQSITLTQPVADKSITVELVNTNGTWVMTRPVAAAVNDLNMRALVALLGNFHANSIIEIGTASEIAAYGLDPAPVQLTYTYQPAPVVQVTSNGATTVPAEPQSLSVHVAQREDGVFALRTENESAVYRVDANAWNTLTAELRKTDLFAFEPDQVTRITFRDGDTVQGFDRETGKWAYVPEADIPINDQAVTNYLVRVRDLRVSRVVEYNAADLAAYGLAEPAYEVNLAVEGAALPALQISQSKDESGAHYAKSADSPHVFLLPADTLQRVRIDLAEFESRT